MNQKERSLWVVKVAVAIPLYTVFDYRIPKTVVIERLHPGVRVKVPFGQRTQTGFVISLADNTEYESQSLKPIHKVLDDFSLLSQVDIELLHWASEYYHHPLGEVFSTAFPVLLRQGQPLPSNIEKFLVLTDSGQSLDTQSLKRAPKQLELVELIQLYRNEFPLTQLSPNPSHWRSAIQALKEKGYVVIEEQARPPKPYPKARVQASTILVNPAQQVAVDAICESLQNFAVFLLEGVTGSGKTEVYLQVIERALALDRQVMVLLPEITLTPQLEKRFVERFKSSICVFHSRLSETARQQAWLAMQRGHCSILLGTRSAVFTPILRPGLIIIDEEHDTSFKQQEGFRFSARDVAIVKAKMLQIPVILGTATPSLESLSNAYQQRYRHLSLPERAGCASQPSFRLLDIRSQKLIEGFSQPLLQQIRDTLSQGDQVLIFLNRRGFAPTLICHACAWVAKCERCDANLVIHRKAQSLRCHHCGYSQILMHRCSACGSEALHSLGLGTERVETALSSLFENFQAIRIDRDTTLRKGSLERALEAINTGAVQLILGTQMLAKGHHFPNVTLVVLLDVDSGLFSTDFHATERLAQLIVQVAGRAGRAEKPGHVVLQTRQPQHPLLQILLHQGYSAFAQKALEERKIAGLPPFHHLGLFRAVANSKQLPMLFLQRVKQYAENSAKDGLNILGPVPAPMPKRAGRYRFQLLIESNQRKKMHDLIDHLIVTIEGWPETKKVRWSLDIDPVDLY